MSDRKIFINERVDTLQLKQKALDLTYYGFEALGRPQRRLDGYNPAISPLTEAAYVRQSLARNSFPKKFRDEWKGADDNLTLLLKDIRVLGKPENIWKKLFQRFQYATELPTIDQAVGYLSLAESRLRHLVNERDQPQHPSIGWSARVYVENMMLKGAFMGSTFLIQPDRPNLN